ncbi:hypothetical protein FLA_1818 [Filimonas lacunae]|nr:hypothetical protein FLA_1818 [Filimonas lacunae]
MVQKGKLVAIAVKGRFVGAKTVDTNARTAAIFYRGIICFWLCLLHG